LIFSFLLPVMLLAARRTHWLTLLILSAWALLLASGERSGTRSTLAWGVVYLERDRTRRWIAALPSWLSLVLVPVALALFSAPLILGWSVPAADSGILVGGGDPRGILIMGIGSAALVSLAVDVPWWRRLLSMRPVAFLGKTSFSLYLLHWVVITLAAPRIETSVAWLDALLLFAIVLGVSIPLSAFFYQWAERPSIAAGSRCSAWISARAGAKRVS
jgi:peptidoglycan/LPS O-acetylase OafA/YrhL